MTGARIQMTDIRFSYRDWAVHFDLDVAAAGFVGIIGPSGAGKSTLLSLIAGFEEPTGGAILIDGTDVTQQPAQTRPVTMVFQDHNTFAHLDVFTNVALGVAPDLRLSAGDRDRIDAAIDRVGLAGFERRKPGQLSGGERQRVALARAIVRDRPILLLDEPFTALGPAMRDDMLELIGDLHSDRGMTVVMVTHHPADARAWPTPLPLSTAARSSPAARPMNCSAPPTCRRSTPIWAGAGFKSGTPGRNSEAAFRAKPPGLP